MTILIMLSIFLGVIFGLYVFPEGIVQYVEQGVTWGLCVMLFFVGIDIGRSKDVFIKIKKLGWKIALIPFSIAMGSVLGAAGISIVIELPLWEAAAVGAGMGWYSLSAVIIDQLHSTQLGAIAFLSNVMREIMAILLLPLLAKYSNKLYTIAPAGATAMDTTLPLIARYTSPEIAVLAFISGAVLTTVIPFLVPFFLQFA